MANGKTILEVPKFRYQQATWIIERVDPVNNILPLVLSYGLLWLLRLRLIYFILPVGLIQLIQR